MILHFPNSMFRNKWAKMATYACHRHMQRKKTHTSWRIVICTSDADGNSGSTRISSWKREKHSHLNYHTNIIPNVQYFHFLTSSSLTLTIASLYFVRMHVHIHIQAPNVKYIIQLVYMYANANRIDSINSLINTHYIIIHTYIHLEIEYNIYIIIIIIIRLFNMYIIQCNCKLRWILPASYSLPCRESSLVFYLHWSLTIHLLTPLTPDRTQVWSNTGLVWTWGDNEQWQRKQQHVINQSVKGQDIPEIIFGSIQTYHVDASKSLKTQKIDSRSARRQHFFKITIYRIKKG